VVISSDNCGQSGGKFFCRSCVAKRGGPSGPSPGAAAVAKVQQVREEKAAGGGAVQTRPASGSVAPNPDRPGATFLDLATLSKLTPDDCKARDIEFSQKENWLSPADFTKAFSMDKATFGNLPAWKKQRIKKNLGLN